MTTQCRDDVAMLIHCEESATTKTAPFRRNPLGVGGFGPQALSLVGHDEKTSFRSSLRACNPKTPARGPRDFCHGLLRITLEETDVGRSQCRAQQRSDDPNSRSASLDDRLWSTGV